ncbi:MAG: MFS transporter [Candidatus Heimdallarchaeota archaeon]|nr:MFS transporter [Candidatus Heimdallarchaeota archaeon]MBY8994550.1 MFS transporter [Candidatus Heimdallarchaeota archaeon]
MEETAEIDTQKATEEKRQTNDYKLKLFSLAGISSAAIFVARTFLGLYAVFLEASTTALSLITSLRNLIQQAFQSTFGRISDNIGRRIMMFIGLLGCGITLAIFPLIQNEWVLVGAVVAFSIGFASFYPSFTALQGDLTTKKNRTGLISLITIIGGGATLVYLIIVGFLGDLGETNPRQFLIIFEVTAALFVICAIVSLILYEPKVKKITEQRIFSLKPIKENKTFRRFVIANSVVAFFMSVGWPIFPIVRGTFASNKENTWVWAFFCLFQVIILLAINPLINKVKKTTLLFIGRIGMFYVPINLAITIYWLPYWWHLAIAGATSGLCNALYWVGQNSYILDSAPEEEKGTYTGIHNLFIGLSTFLGSLSMGLIADHITIVNEWRTIFVLLLIIAAGRFLSSLGFLFIGEPKTTSRIE